MKEEVREREREGKGGKKEMSLSVVTFLMTCFNCPDFSFSSLFFRSHPLRSFSFPSSHIFLDRLQLLLLIGLPFLSLFHLMYTLSILKEEGR